MHALSANVTQSKHIHTAVPRQSDPSFLIYVPAVLESSLTRVDCHRFEDLEAVTSFRDQIARVFGGTIRQSFCFGGRSDSLFSPVRIRNSSNQSTNDCGST